MPLITYKDLIDHSIDYCGADVSAEATKAARRAVQAAYRDFTTGHRWVMYYQRGRVTTNASQTSGTVTYDHTGGTYERMLTISGSTWPTWSNLGAINISNIIYEVDEYKTTTVITLSRSSNPGADVAAGTSYTLYRDSYPLPTDFLSMDELVNQTRQSILTMEHPREWLATQRLLNAPSEPGTYTIMGDPNYYGALALRLYPAPEQAYRLDFIYQRRPRNIKIEEYSTGTVAIANASTVVTGTGTTWTSSMNGSVIRFSANNTNLPTGLSGDNPYQLERVISNVASGTSLTVDAASSEALTTVKYTISDPVDIEDGAMATALLRECEKQMRLLRRMKPTPEEIAEYQMAIIQAKERDSRSFRARAPGLPGWLGTNLAHTPSKPDW